MISTWLRVETDMFVELGENTNVPIQWCGNQNKMFGYHTKYLTLLSRWYHNLSVRLEVSGHNLRPTKMPKLECYFPDDKWAAGLVLLDRDPPETNLHQAAREMIHHTRHTSSGMGMQVTSRIPFTSSAGASASIRCYAAYFRCRRCRLRAGCFFFLLRSVWSIYRLFGLL